MAGPSAAHTSIPNSSAASAVGTAGMGGAEAGPSRRRLREDGSMEKWYIDQSMNGCEWLIVMVNVYR